MRKMNVEIGKIKEAIDKALDSGQIRYNDILESISSWHVVNSEGWHPKITLHFVDDSGMFSTNIDVHGSVRERKINNE